MAHYAGRTFRHHFHIGYLRRGLKPRQVEPAKATAIVELRVAILSGTTSAQGIQYLEKFLVTLKY